MKPKVIVLSGSVRFFSTFQEWYIKIACQGNIPFSVVGDLKDRSDYHEWKPFVDKMYFNVIDFLADEMFVLNVGGYIGESTRNEINRAKLRDMPINYLEPINEYR